MPSMGSTFISLLLTVGLARPPTTAEGAPAEPGDVAEDSVEAPAEESEPASEQPIAEPEPAPEQPPVPEQQPAPAPTGEDKPAKKNVNPGAAIGMAKGIKETVMGSVFLSFGAVGLGVGIPTILSGVERNKQEDGSGSLRIAGGAAATGLGGLLTLFGVILLPIGVAKIVRAKKASVALDWDPGRSWSAGVRLRF